MNFTQLGHFPLLVLQPRRSPASVLTPSTSCVVVTLCTVRTPAPVVLGTLVCTPQLPVRSFLCLRHISYQRTIGVILVWGLTSFASRPPTTSCSIAPLAPPAHHNPPSSFPSTRNISFDAQRPAVETVIPDDPTPTTFTSSICAAPRDPKLELWVRN